MNCCKSSNFEILINNFENEDSNLINYVFLHNTSINMTPDSNPYTKIIVVIDGLINVEVNSKNLNIYKNNVLFINAHSEILITPISTESNFLLIQFKKNFFDSDFMSRLSKYENFFKFINYCIYNKDSKKCNMLFHVDNNTILIKILETLFIYIDIQDYNLASSLLLHLFEFLNINIYSKFISLYSTRIDNKLSSDIVKYINENYKSINLTKLSKKFSYHPNYMSKLIKDLTGKSFNSHIKDLRLNQASYLLLNTNLLVRNICYNVGYNDLSYFNKIFKEKYNCTPSDFRNNKNKIF